MSQTIAVPLGAKAQMTLPRAVRKALHVREPGEYVCFTIDAKGRVALTRAEIVPSHDPFTDEEWKKIRRLAAGPAVTFSSSRESLKYLRSRLDAAR